jgi:CheY-like chemotaxis protein
VADADSSKIENSQSRVEFLTAKNNLLLWDSADLLRIDRPEGQTAVPLRVLLAEDNPIDQLCIRRLLEKHGIKVHLAGDGRQAVEAFEGGTFDLVLLDILMPEMDGFEVALHIREHETAFGCRAVPVIALTAYSLRAVYDKCRSVGMNGYLSKPVTSGDLQELFSLLLPDSAGLIGF